MFCSSSANPWYLIYVIFLISPQFHSLPTTVSGGQQISSAKHRPKVLWAFFHLGTERRWWQCEKSAWMAPFLSFVVISVTFLYIFIRWCWVYSMWPRKLKLPCDQSVLDTAHGATESAEETKHTENPSPPPPRVCLWSGNGDSCGLCVLGSTGGTWKRRWFEELRQ